MLEEVVNSMNAVRTHAVPSTKGAVSAKVLFEVDVVVSAAPACCQHLLVSAFKFDTALKS